MAQYIRQVTLVGAIAAAFAAAPSFGACTPADINGSAMPAGTAVSRTIRVATNTKSVNVKYGETVKFVMPDGQEAIWKFDGLAGKMNLGTLFATRSASAGSSANGGSKIPVYVDQGGNPISTSCSAGE